MGRRWRRFLPSGGASAGVWQCPDIDPGAASATESGHRYIAQLSWQIYGRLVPVENKNIYLRLSQYKTMILPSVCVLPKT